jgi:hypothetical protein
VDLSTFIVAVFCLMDDQLKGRRITEAAPPHPQALSEAEVLTIEVVGVQSAHRALLHKERVWARELWHLTRAGWCAKSSPTLWLSSAQP